MSYWMASSGNCLVQFLKRRRLRTAEPLHILYADPDGIAHASVTVAPTHFVTILHKGTRRDRPSPNAPV
jgi:hypothetical protein